MRYNRIRKMDVSNGEGIRISLFTQGCDIHCPMCFNKEAWDYDGGEEFTDETIYKILDLCDHDYISGLSILGGEPFSMPNIDGLYKLLKTFKSRFPQKTVWIWSGHKYEFLILNSDFRDILNMCDVLVDGPFIEQLHKPDLHWRGSTNQHVWKKINNQWTVIE